MRRALEYSGEWLCTDGNSLLVRAYRATGRARGRSSADRRSTLIVMHLPHDACAHHLQAAAMPAASGPAWWRCSRQTQ